MYECKNNIKRNKYRQISQAISRSIAQAGTRNSRLLQAKIYKKRTLIMCIRKLYKSNKKSALVWNFGNNMEYSDSFKSCQELQNIYIYF